MSGVTVSELLEEWPFSGACPSPYPDVPGTSISHIFVEQGHCGGDSAGPNERSKVQQNNDETRYAVA